jgi:hypothetical protein
VAIAAQALGIAEAAARTAAAYAKARVQFGRPICEIPAVYEMLAQMRIRIEAARALTYHTADVVERLKWQERHADGAAAPGASKEELKRLTRLAAVLTPLAKLYATEMANTVASDALQVLGGSGYMKDYPVERHFRDARITNIYEGTTQLQVVGAIGGIRTGVLRAYIEGLLAQAAANSGSCLVARGSNQEPPTTIHQPPSTNHEPRTTNHEPQYAKVAALLPELDKALAAADAHEKETDFNDLYARWLVSIGLDILLAALLALQAATGNERKRIVAEAFIAEAKHRVRAAAEHVQAGSSVLIKGHQAIIGL